MRQIVVRTLRREFLLPDAEPTLTFLEAWPTIVGGPGVPEVVRIERREGSFVASFSGQTPVSGSIRYLTAWLDRRILALAVEDEVGAVALQAALLTASSGSRVLLAGGRRTGKSLLAAHLFAAGWAFEADERVFISANGVIAHPRPMRLPRSQVRRMPALAPLIEDAPSLDIDGKDLIYSLDPTRRGRDWRIASGPVAAVFFLDNAERTLSTLRRIGVDEACARAMQLASMVHGVSVHGIATLRAMLGNVPAFHLELGSPESAIESVCHVLEGVGASPAH